VFCDQSGLTSFFFALNQWNQGDLSQKEVLIILGASRQQRLREVVALWGPFGAKVLRILVPQKYLKLGEGSN
jgi:hypothetical protein